MLNLHESFLKLYNFNTGFQLRILPIRWKTFMSTSCSHDLCSGGQLYHWKVDRGSCTNGNGLNQILRDIVCPAGMELCCFSVKIIACGMNCHGHVLEYNFSSIFEEKSFIGIPTRIIIMFEWIYFSCWGSMPLVWKKIVRLIPRWNCHANVRITKDEFIF